MAKAGIPFSFLAILMYILPMAHAQPMAHPQMAMAPATRLDKLNVAASLHVFDKTLDRRAWESLGWGAFSLVVGIFLLIAGASPLGTALLLPLENRFPSWDSSRGAPAGLIVLGGVISPDISVRAA